MAARSPRRSSCRAGNARRRGWRPGRSVLVVLAPLAIMVALTGCRGEEAVPIDPANPPTTLDLTDVTHQIEPSEEMQDLAERQCLDDPALDEGYVQAVDPATGDVMARVTVDCAEVRGEVRGED